MGVKRTIIYLNGFRKLHRFISQYNISFLSVSDDGSDMAVSSKFLHSSSVMLNVELRLVSIWGVQESAISSWSLYHSMPHAFPLLHMPARIAAGNTIKVLKIHIDRHSMPIFFVELRNFRAEISHLLLLVDEMMATYRSTDSRVSMKMDTSMFVFRAKISKWGSIRVGRVTFWPNDYFSLISLSWKRGLFVIYDHIPPFSNGIHWLAENDSIAQICHSFLESHRWSSACRYKYMSSFWTRVWLLR